MLHPVDLPLLEHLLLHVARMPVLYDVDGADGRIATVLLDQLSAAPVEKLNFPMPADLKLRKVAAALMADPADRATIEDWARRLAVAPRTLTRILQRETGMSFGRWRQQLHILIALQRLAQGRRSRRWRLSWGMRAPAPSSPCSARPWANRPPAIWRNAASRPKVRSIDRIWQYIVPLAECGQVPRSLSCPRRRA